MRKYVWIALTSFVVGLLLAGYIFIYVPEKHAPKTSPFAAEQDPAPAVSSTLFAGPAPEVKTNLDFVTISEKVGPAVVKIESQRKEKVSGMFSEEGDPFQDFWDRFFGQQRPRRPQEQTVTAQGTGFFISPDGYILTNNHLVEESTEVTVSTVQGKDYEAKIIGTDPRTDIALLKIEAKNLPYAELGDSSQVKVGEWVLAIGNPYGMDHTVTAGIVSAKGRQIDTGDTYQDFIQTDAAINRGNSGGPLINMKGEVIGITSNIFTPTGGNIGIGFAIPSNMANKVVVQLREKGKVTRGRIGVTVVDISAGMMKQWKLSSRKGAVIASVEAGSPADKAGVKQYDVVTAVDGQAVENRNDLGMKIGDVPPGKKVALTIIRDGKQITVSPVAEDLEPQSEKEQAASPDKTIGLTLQPLSPNVARRYGLRTTEGLLITEIQPGSEAARRGLEPGMIIVEANRTKVTTTREFENLLKKTDPGDEIILSIRSEANGQVQEFIVPVKVR